MRRCQTRSKQHDFQENAETMYLLHPDTSEDQRVDQQFVHVEEK